MCVDAWLFEGCFLVRGVQWCAVDGSLEDSAEGKWRFRCSARCRTFAFSPLLPCHTAWLGVLAPQATEHPHPLCQ